MCINSHLLLFNKDVEKEKSHMCRLNISHYVLEHTIVAVVRTVLVQDEMKPEPGQQAFMG